MWLNMINECKNLKTLKLKIVIEKLFISKENVLNVHKMNLKKFKTMKELSEFYEVENDIDNIQN